MSPTTISEKGQQDDYDPFDWSKDSESSDTILQQQSLPLTDVHSTIINNKRKHFQHNKYISNTKDYDEDDIKNNFFFGDIHYTIGHDWPSLTNVILPTSKQ